MLSCLSTISIASTPEMFKNSQEKVAAQSEIIASLYTQLKNIALNDQTQNKSQSVVNVILRGSEVLSDSVPVIGSTMAAGLASLRGNLDEQMRLTGIQLLLQNIELIPNDVVMASDIEQIVKPVLLELPGQTPTNALHQKWMSVISDQIVGMSKYVIAYTEEVTDLQDQTKLVNNIAGSVLDLDTRAQVLEEQTQEIVQLPTKTPEQALQEKYTQATRSIQHYAEHAASAASIASRLGDEDTAKALGKVSHLVGVGASVLTAFSGNPMAALGAIDSTLSLFGEDPSPDPVFAQLEEVTGQLQELRETIQKNHQEVISKLDDLQFLGKIQLDGITALLSHEIERCKNLIPIEFRVSDQAIWNADFVDIEKNIKINEYEKLSSIYSGGTDSWQ